MLSAYRKVYEVLTPSMRRWAGIALVMMLVNGLLEALSVTSVFPLLLTATRSSYLQEFPVLQGFLLHLGWGEGPKLVVVSALAFGALFVLVNLWAALTLWTSSRFTEEVRHHLSTKLLRTYLAKPYSWHLTRNSTALAKNVLQEVDDVAEYLVFGLVLCTTYALSSLLIVVGLMVLEPLVALGTALVLITLYKLVYHSLRPRLKAVGEQRHKANEGRFQHATEALAAVKETRLSRGLDVLSERYERPARKYANTETSHQLMAELPRYTTEVIAILTILALLSYLLINGQETFVPFMALYITATWRLVPALQSIYRNSVRVKYHLPSLREIHRQLSASSGEAELEDPETLRFEKTLALEKVSFSYPDCEELALRDLSVEIACGETLVLVGKTGEGKTTCADVIAGYLEAEDGAVLLDGKPLDHGELARWRASVGYVPQDVYLLDDTVRRNIALGVPDGEILEDRLERAAQEARIHQFVVEELAESYQTVLGERGVTLSGGQKQRLGIARALYHDPKFLILDEATSALDRETEAAILSELCGDAERTVVLVAHRESTASFADRFALIEQGELRASGPIEELPERGLLS